MESPPRPPSRSLDALTGLRFVAAAHVVWYHYGAVAPHAAVEQLRGFGWTAVTLFFVLSGFLLTYRYSGGPLQPGPFLRARAARIYPAHLLALVATLLVWTPGSGWGLGAGGWLRQVVVVLLNGLLVQNWLFVPHLNIPTWSLSVEVFLYLCFPWLLRALWSLPRGRLPWVLGVCGVASLVAFALVWGVATWRGEARLPWEQRWGIWVSNLPLLRLAPFVVGMVLGRWFVEGRGVARGAGLWTWSGLCGLVVPMLLFPRGWPTHDVLAALLLPAQAALVWGLAHGGGRVLGALLGARPLVLLGEYSYAVYVFQMPLALAWHRFPVLGPLRESFPLYAAGLIAVSAVVFHAVERPARDALRGGGRRPDPGGLAVPGR